MRELQRIDEDYDTLTKYRKQYKIDDSTKKKTKTFIVYVYELLKTGILFCLFVQLLRNPGILSLFFAPIITVAATLLKIIGVIVVIAIILGLLA